MALFMLSFTACNDNSCENGQCISQNKECVDCNCQDCEICKNCDKCCLMNDCKNCEKCSQNPLCSCHVTCNI